MAITSENIVDPTSTVPANSEDAPKEADSSGIPEAVLEIPLMKGMLEGAPPAVFAPVGSKSPEIATVLKYGKELNAAGFGFFRDEKNKLDVFFNTKYTSPELVKAAARKDKIPEIASPLLETIAQFNDAVGIPAGGGAPVSAGGVPSSVPVDSPLDTQRKNNLMPGSPTSGPVPAGGRVLNSILTPTV